MKVSIILPTCLLKNCVNPFYLAYATVVANDQAYSSFFMDKVREGCEVILDYSPQIPRVTPDLNLYQSVIKILKPTKVVLPGVDFDWKSTIRLSKTLKENLKDLDTDWIGLIEGHDAESIKSCYSNLTGISMLALPSSLEKIARRDEVIRYLGIEEKVLYLEIFKNPYEEIPPKSVAGICTSFPTRLALDHRLLREFIPEPPPLDFSVPKERLDKNLVRDIIREYLDLVF